MIVRREPDGSLILITQNDHAKLSGLFAAHWGNAVFARPQPWESVVRAAAYHDWGWSRYETEPLYDEARGTAPTFQEVPNSGHQLAAYQDAIDRLWEIDPYAGLLVSRHRTGLWRQRYGAVEVAPTQRNLGPEVDAMTSREEARQELALHSLDRKIFAINYQLLQIYDLLSLYLCTGSPVARTIASAPSDYAGDGHGGTPLTLTPRETGLIGIAPFPFDASALDVSLVYRRLPVGAYPSQAAFREAYFGAAPKVMSFRFEG